MPLFGEVLREINTTPDPTTGQPGFDIVRRSYLARLAAHTNRAAIIYYSAFLEGRPSSIDHTVNPLDINGFMTAVAGIQHREVDLILHTPGGTATAAEAIIEYLRTRFDHIRAVIPHMAMSAGTMMALGCDEIVMASHSNLGPIDPQFTIQTPSGTRTSPAAEILRQFEQAQEEVQEDNARLLAWSPILAGYGPGLLSQCVTERELGEKMVADWLRRYMFRHRDDAAAISVEAAKWFATYEQFGNHGRPLHRDKVRAQGIVVTDLEANQELQDLVLSVHHACMAALNVGAQKIIENNLGNALIRSAPAQGIPIPFAIGPVQPIPPIQPPGPPGPPAPPAPGGP